MVCKDLPVHDWSVFQASDLVEALGLARHPEGGWYREIYRSAGTVIGPNGTRSGLTAIYYLLEAGQLSRWHVVASDEVWCFVDGTPLELITWDDDHEVASAVRLARGAPRDGEVPWATVPAGWWQAARPTGAWSLATCLVAPGFDFSDFRFVTDLPDWGRAFEGALAAYRGLL